MLRQDAGDLPVHLVSVSSCLCIGGSDWKKPNFEPQAVYMSSTPKPSGETKKRSKSVRSGLQFPVARIQRQLKKGRYAERVGSGGPIYLAAVMEYLMAEILELAGNAASDNKKNRITPRHVMLAVRNDEELSKLFSNATFAQGGVVPKIAQGIVPTKNDTTATTED
uniref:Histone H2A n=1 Tax=Steinernema glaseri TaxID=37863 RepID=A0A1I7YQI7_9BILA